MLYYLFNHIKAKLSYHFLLVLNFCCFLPQLVCGQFDPNNFNQKLLEHEIKILIDSTRNSHGLHSLFNDSILYMSSLHHADYMLKKSALSHVEVEFPTYFKPQDRANAFGAPSSYFVGENVAFTLYNSNVKVKDKVFKTNNYQEIARSLVYSWVNSKGHFKNIINPDYQITGLAVSVDPKQNRIYACQKFAHVVYTYTFSDNKQFFPYSTLKSGEAISKEYTISKRRYPFNLKDDKINQCNECKEIWKYYPPISVRVSNKNFILRIEDVDFVKNLTLNKHDGFAIEIVPFDAFACGNPDYELEPSRRNSKLRTSGQLLEPVYRNDLIKGFKKRKKANDISFVKHIFQADSISFFKRFGQYKLVKFDAKYFEIKLGRIPKEVSGWWNHNLVYIHNKQICHISYLTNYPGELITEILDVDYYPPIPINNYEFELDSYTDSLEIFFKAGETVSSNNKLEQIIKHYKENHITIKDITINSFCSVEGDSLINETLHKQRAENILKRIEILTDSTTSYKIHSKVAWDHFYESIKDHSKWKFLHPMTTSEIRTYLSNPKNERPHEILEKERKVKVVITGVKEFSSKTANYYIQRDLKRLFFKDKSGYLQCRNATQLQNLYEKAYYLSTVDTISVEDFLKIEIPKPKNGFSHTLEQDMVFYRYHYLHKEADKSSLLKLESNVESLFVKCGAPDHLSPEFHYLSACLLVRKIERKGNQNQPNNPDIQKAFDRLTLLLNAYNLPDSFQINVSKANLNIINVLCENISPEQIYEYSDIVNRSLIQIVTYYRRTNQLNESSVLNLAKLLCYFENIPLAVELCREYLHDNEVLKLYLPLAYSHSSYLSSDEAIKFEKDFHSLLFEAKSRLTNSEWCALFFGNLGIPFQVMDNASLREEFCASCPNRITDVLSE